MLSKSIRILLRYFDVWGFWTEYFNNPAWKYFLYSLYIIHVCIVAVSTFFIVYLTIFPIFNYPDWFLLNEILKNHSISFTYWSILFESFFQRDKQRQFWKLLRQTHTYNSHRILLQMYLVKFVKHFVMIVFIEVILISRFHGTGPMFITFICVRVILLELYQSRLFHYLLYLEIIKSHIRILEHDVNSLWKVNQRNYFRRGRRTKSQIGICYFNKIRKTREQYQQIFDLVDCVNGIFGWSNFFTLLLAFQNAFASINWAFQALSGFSWFGAGSIFFRIEISFLKFFEI